MWAAEYDVLQSWPFDKVSVRSQARPLSAAQTHRPHAAAALQVGAWIVEHNNEEPKRANVIALLKRAQKPSRFFSPAVHPSSSSSTHAAVRALVLARARLHAVRGGERGGGRLLRRPEVLAPGAGGQGLARPPERFARLLTC